MPASGKSTIAVRISESLGIPMLSKDSIKDNVINLSPSFQSVKKRA